VGLGMGSVRVRRRGQPGGARRLAAGAAVLLAMMFMFVAALATLGGASLVRSSPSGGVGASGASSLAQRDVPAAYLRLYLEAAQRYGLDWAILAGIGKVECDHGRDPDPSCKQRGAVNQAGAGGPMQFLASTWRLYGVDGNGDGRADRWDPADAIYAAANYLRASGAPQSYSRALYAYNHSQSYVDEVERWAARYRAAASSQSPPEEGGAETVGAGVLQDRTSTAVRLIAGERAALAPWDGHLALVPAAVPLRVQAMVIAGNELQALPYGPGGHPDPRGAAEEDCSSSVSYVLYRAGIRPIGEIVRDNPLAQDYVRWGLPGSGRWVSVYATTTPTDHVFIVIAGLRLDTSHNGTDVGPNRGEDGPRWRLLGHTPTWARWSVRHPPGL
jgi:Transglycosylase SLT domain